MTTPDPDYHWTQVEHTADLAISISASSHTDLFLAALDGLLGILEIRVFEPDPAKITPIHHSQDSGSIESNLVDFLNECLYLMEVEELVPYKIESINYIGTVLEADMRCRDVINEDSDATGQIKSTTYSDLEVQKVDDRFEATIIFDT